MAVASLSLQNLARHYGKVRAVDDLSVEVPDGAFVTLLGPSGCGKSTTLNLIAGLDQPTAGTILLGDRDITKTPPNERRMAMVFQAYALYPNMTVFDNIGFSLKLRHRPGSEIQARVTAVAEMLDIAHLLARKPSQLSGGQQQRVALGRALVKEPLVFLLDEPFSNLDAALRSRMRTEVKHLHVRLGTTSIFVTHDQEEAMTLSDVIAVMRDGKLVQFGSQQEVYSRPRNVYVATFVGKPRMSLVDGALERSADGVAFVAPGLRLDLGTAAAIGLKEGEFASMAAGFRSEDVHVTTAAAPRGPLAFEATVQLLEPIGSDTFVELAVGDATIIARVAPDLPLQLGQKVTAEATQGRVHLFDRATGERINA
jgi:ABC-type sugar transport system ATPase subunit